MIPAVTDRFNINGPNGVHPCIVTVPARCNLRQTTDAGDTGLFQLGVARYSTAQLATAVF
jgi:serine/threonine-protein kinase SRPK3